MIYKNLDRFIILAMCGLLCIGLLSLYSASYQTAPHLIIRQMVWIGLGTIFFLIALLVDYHKILQIAYLLYGICVVALVSVIVVGETKSGAQRWLTLGEVNLQPSEAYKIAAIMALSKFFADPIQIRQRHYLFAIIIGIAPVYLIIRQPDLGSGIIVVALVLSMLWMAGARPRFFAYLVAGMFITCPVLWHFLKDYQKDRLLVFINPDRDPLGAGYTIIQSKISIGSGRIFGKGWLGGTQNQLNFLPERHTDFIFSVIGEEWGIIGACILISLFLVLVHRGLTIALRTNEPRGRLLAGGISSIIGFQAIINIGMTIGLFPVVGIPLPLISYGGSSLITTMFMIGLLENVNARRARF